MDGVFFFAGVMCFGLEIVVVAIALKFPSRGTLIPQYVDRSGPTYGRMRGTATHRGSNDALRPKRRHPPYVLQRTEPSFPSMSAFLGPTYYGMRGNSDAL